MKHKAKRLDNGEWVKGYFDGADKNYPAIRVEGIGDEFYLIDPSTLCQQVRGTELFEGDEMIMNKFYGDVKGFLEYSEINLEWYVHTEQGDYHPSESWKPTGKNKYDI